MKYNNNNNNIPLPYQMVLNIKYNNYSGSITYCSDLKLEYKLRFCCDIAIIENTCFYVSNYYCMLVGFFFWLLFLLLLFFLGGGGGLGIKLVYQKNTIYSEIFYQQDKGKW